MKTFIAACLLLSLTSCASLLTQRIRRPDLLTVTKSDAKLYAYDGSASIGEEVKGISPNKGDSLKSPCYFFRGSAFGNYYVINYNDKEYLINGEDIFNITEKEYKDLIKSIETRFTIAASENDDAWARAYNYLFKKPGVNFSAANEFLLETADAKTNKEIKYKITRFPQSNTVTYEVDCSGMIGAPTYEEEKVLAYYIKTGDLIKIREH